MKILITGSNGLLGQKLVAALRNDPEVQLVATSRGADRTPIPLGLQYRSMDITVQAEVDEVFATTMPEVVIHTAAMTNVDACELDPAACQLQNVTATEHVVQAAKRHGCHFIHLDLSEKDGIQGEEAAQDQLLAV